jgi:hypothetical protein
MPVKIPEQVKRLGVVIGVLIAVTVLGRFVLVPRELVARDLHVAATVARETAHPIKFAGVVACAQCHEDILAKKAKSFHKNVACEVCHGPSAKHADDPGTVKPPAPRDRKFCPVCHTYDPARPTGFPQINPATHNPTDPCIKCHEPHDPVPPTTPRECSACHAQIESAKALSSHAKLECTTCHKAPPTHKTSPRAALPSIPQSRQFCAGCHGKEAANKEAPKIDVGEHGAPFMCWECHYPHLPEGRG